MKPVYITRLSSFLPNEPVGNDEIEHVLGLISEKNSKAKLAVLRNNGIRTRYYAFRDGKSTHTNAELAATAVNKLFDADISIKKVKLLSASTSSPEQVLPAHASMVHGLLGDHPMEIATTTGACCTGLQALKYAYMSVAAGNTDVAVSCGSEKTSTWMHASRFQEEADKLDRLHEEPIIAFEKDFLRFMLSDGAGAALLQDVPADAGLSLKIEWIDIRSYANELAPCMYAGAVKNGGPALIGWNDLETIDWATKSVFSFKQDTTLLAGNIIPHGGDFLADLMKKRDISSDNVDYFLPHLSSEYFKKEMTTYLDKVGMPIAPEKWFYNLTKTGNIGSASAYVMLDELFHSGRLKKGDHILVMVPESARFTYAYMYLAAV